MSRPEQKTMTKQELGEMYRAYLAEEGYVPRIDDYGDVVFKVEGQTYVIVVDENDPSFFRLAFPAFWEIENEEERLLVERAAVFASEHTKVVKVYPINDNVWATIEAFCYPPDSFKAFYPRAIHALQAGVRSFRERMFELRKQQVPLHDAVPND